MKSLFVFFFLVFFIFLNEKIFGQLEEFQMRQFIESVQRKPQTVGEISQKIEIIHTDSLAAFFSNTPFVQLRNHSALYLTANSSHQFEIAYRGSSRGQLAIDQTNLPIKAISTGNILKMLSGLYSQIDVLYGISTAMYGKDATNFTINITPTQWENELEHKNSIYAGAFSNTQSVLVNPKFWVENSKIKSSTQLYFQKNNQYNIGTALDDRFGSWGQAIEFGQTHDIPGQNYTQLGLLQQLKYQISDQKNITFLGIFSNATQTASILPNGQLNYSRPSLFIHSQLGYHLSSEEKWYTKLNLKISYSHYEENGSEQRNTRSKEYFLKNNGLAISFDFYKNHSARWVFFSNGQLFFNGVIQNNAYRTLNFGNNAIDHNIGLQLGGKVEYRQSDNTSFFMGANADFQHVNAIIYNLQTGENHNPSSKFYNFNTQLTWARHSCENNNYAATIFVNYTMPTFLEMYQIQHTGRHFSVEQLKNATNIGIEGHYYKKIEDQLEIHFQPHAQFSNQAARNFTDYSKPITPTDSVVFYNNYLIIHDATEWQLGASLSLKYHLTKNVLTYGNAQYIYGRMGDQFQNNIPPIYGSFGVKWQVNKWFFGIYCHYSGAKSVGLIPPTDFKERVFGPTDHNRGGLVGYPAFFSLNANLVYSPTPYLRVGIGANNILNQNYRYYGSMIHELGRNFSLQAKIIF